jgi:chromosome partitioning protein
MFTAEIPRLKAFEHAVTAGVPVYGLKGNAQARRGWGAYEAAWSELQGVVSVRAARAKRHA